jgi:hypothetical protein
MSEAKLCSCVRAFIVQDLQCEFVGSSSLGAISLYLGESKFDASLVTQICDVLKQAAIEEGQWTEKRETKGGVGMSEIMARLNAGRDRCAAAKRAADEKTKHDAAAALSRPPAS